MDQDTRNILDGFKQLAGKPQMSIIVTVRAVNEDARTVDVETDEDLNIYDVNLQAVSGASTGFLIIPTIGSQVVISQGEEGIWMVIGFTDFDKISLKNDSEDLKQLLSDLLDAIKEITVTTAVGPSGTPINAESFELIKTRLNSLLK